MDIISKIKKRAAEMKYEEQDFDYKGCIWYEHIPKFYRGETDKEIDAYIQEHLKSCKECNLLLAALAAQKLPEKDAALSWIKQGAQYIFERTVSLLTGNFVPVSVTRSTKPPETEYCLDEQKIELADKNILCIRTVKQGENKIVTAFVEDGSIRRYDLYDDSQKFIKSVDDNAQFKFVMPRTNFTMVIDKTYIVHFEGSGEMTEAKGEK